MKAISSPRQSSARPLLRSSCFAAGVFSAELDLAIVDYLHVISPWIEEVDRAGRLHADPCCLQSCSDGLLVVHDQPEVARLIWGLASPGGHRDELVADINERHRRACAATQLEFEETSVPREGFLDVTDLERDVVDPNEAHGWPAYAITARSPPRASRHSPGADAN